MNYLIGQPSHFAIGVGSATVVFPQNDLLHVTSAFMVVKALLLKAKFTFLFLSPFEFVHSRCTLPQWWPFLRCVAHCLFDGSIGAEGLLCKEEEEDGFLGITNRRHVRMA